MRIKQFLFLFILFGLSSSNNSSAFFGRLFGRDGDCCGSWGVQVHGGVYPVLWHQREATFQNNCPSGSLFNIGVTPKFRHLFKTPWVVGAQLSFAHNDCNDLFLEFNYAQAKNKSIGVNLDCTGCGAASAPNPALSLILNKYQIFSGYLGARYYFNEMWCDGAALFVGGKVGVVHHKHINFRQLTTATVIAGYTSPLFFRSNTVFSGGALIGLDYTVCGNWSLMLTAEAVFNCGPRGAGVIALQTADATSLLAQNLIVGCVRSEIAFPITLGLKYNF